MLQLFRQFTEDSSVKRSRSTALYSLQWVMGLILASIPMALYAKSPEWILIFFILSFGILFIVFIGAYIYLLRIDRDALRSENFNLSKMAIEKGLVGDDITGLIEDNDSMKQLNNTEAVKKSEGSK